MIMSKGGTPLEIVVADDHPVFRKGLRHAIEEQPGNWSVREAADGEEAAVLCKQREVAALVADIGMPKLDGFGLVRRLRQERLSIPVMLLTLYDDEELVAEGMRLGVLAYVLKDDDISDCLRALNLVLQGRRYLSPSLVDRLARGKQGLEVLKSTKRDLGQLTATESKVLKLIAQDLTSKEIAAELNCSVHTINAHRQNLSTKLGLKGSHSLLKYAYDAKFDDAAGQDA